MLFASYKTVNIFFVDLVCCNKISQNECRPKNRNTFRTLLETGEAAIKGIAGSVTGEPISLGHRWHLLGLSSHDG
jgi:hypothetical protein